MERCGAASTIYITPGTDAALTQLFMLINMQVDLQSFVLHLYIAAAARLRCQHSVIAHRR